jgi:replicative DNA helicase
MSEWNLKVTVLEKQILRCLFEHNELLDKYEIKSFISPQANEFYLDLLSLKNNNKKIIAENIMTLDNQYLTSDMIVSIQETDYDFNEFEDYIHKLDTKSLIHEFKSDVIDDLNENDSDYEKLENIKFRIEKLENEVRKETDTTSFPSLIREHKEEIKKRASGNKNTTGDFNLDKLIGGYQAGLGLIVGMSGSMKSTFIIKLLRNRITKRLPTCAINTELTHATYMDTLVSTMIDEDYANLTGFNSSEDEDVRDWESILAKLDELEEIYERQDKKRKLFNFYPSNSVSISDIRNFCKKCRKEFRLKDDEILFCTVDLLLMIQDMNLSGSSRADAITQGLNKLNEFALQDNVFILGTIQSRRLQNDIKIDSIDDLKKYKINLSMLKESGSLEERSRVILALHNPKYLANRNPTCPQIVRDLVDPILELTVLKNSWRDNLGETVYYYIDEEHKDLIDFIPKDGEIPNNSSFGIESTEDSIINKIEKELED